MLRFFDRRFGGDGRDGDGNGEDGEGEGARRVIAYEGGEE